LGYLEESFEFRVSSFRSKGNGELRDELEVWIVFYGQQAGEIPQER
jgi:hypothetical protein